MAHQAIMQYAITQLPLFMAVAGLRRLFQTLSICFMVAFR